MLFGMVTMNSEAHDVETEADFQHRLTQEAELIAQARASVAAGRLVSEEEVDAWIDSLGNA